MQQGGGTLQTVLSGIIEGMPGLAVSVAVLFAVVGLAMAAFALLKIYQTVQEGEGLPSGWLVAFGAACLLTIVGVVTGQVSLWLVG